MSTLYIDRTIDLSTYPLSNVEQIVFNDQIGSYTATFANTQFNNVAILDNVYIFPCPGGDTTLVVNGGSVNASGWDFFGPMYRIFLNGGAGNDTIIGSLQADHIRGGGGNDIISGGRNDRIEGGTGNDTITGSLYGSVYGGDGNDTIINTNILGGTWDGGVGVDTINLSANNFNAVIDLSAASFVLNGATFLNFENAQGTQANDTMYGSAGNNQLLGAAGDDSLYGGGGGDLLWGESGVDTLYGDGGNDRLNGSAGEDNCFGGDGDDRFLVYGADLGDNVDGGAGIDVLDLRNWTNTGVGFLVNMAGSVYEQQPNTSGADGIYSLAGVEHVHGTNSNDTIIGDGGNNILVGGGGRDEMSGGLGNDTYYVDTIGDSVIEYSGAGFDTIFSQSGRTVPHYVERLFLLNGGDYNVSGRVGQNDIIIGNDGANIINGLSANDTLNGGLGNDTLSGGLGSDVFQFRTAPDSFANKDVITDFNVANDTIQMDSAVYLLLGANGAMAAALFKNLSLGAQDADDSILYDQVNGNLFYDTNGLAAGGMIHFAEVTNGLALTNADFVVV